MQFNLKVYQKNKIKTTVIENNFLLFTINANQNSQNWILVEQNLAKLGLIYNKTYNNTTKKIIQNSTLQNLKNLINSTFFFIKPKKSMPIKNSTFNLLHSTQFTILNFKLNNRIYSTTQYASATSYHYKKTAAITYQFLLATLKLPTQLNKKFL